jgi:hypothetical protein
MSLVGQVNGINLIEAKKERWTRFDEFGSRPESQWKRSVDSRRLPSRHTKTRP